MIKQTTSAKHQQSSMIAGIFEYMGKGISTIVAVIVLSLAASVAFAGDDEAEKKGTTRLKDIVVTGTKTPHALKDVPVETVLINREDIEKTNAQNAMDILKNIPGIDTSVHDDVFGTYTWRAKMRGLDFDAGYGLILIDGQRAMGCGQSGGMGEYGSGLNQIPVDMIERIEVVKGPSSALYGSDAVAGVINIITKKIPKKATGSAGVSYGWYKVKEEGETKPSDDGHSRNISKTYVSYGDKISDSFGYLLHYNYDSAEDIEKEPVKADRHSFMGKLDGELSKSIDLYLKCELSDYEKIDNRQEDSYRISAGIDFRPTDDDFFSFKGYTYTWDFNHGYIDKTYGHKYGDVGYDQFEIQYTRYFGDWNALTLGGEVQEQGIDYVIENADGSMVNVKEDVDTSSLYVQDEITLFEDFTLVAGLRYDDHSTFGSEVNPKLSLMYKLFKDTTFRASAGKAFKSPTLRQLYYDTPYRHGGYYCKSNPDLKPEKAVGYSASVEQWLFDQSIMINLGYFRNDVDDMVIREDTGKYYPVNVQIDPNLPLKEYRNVEEAWTQGIEFMCRTYFAEEFSASLSYTYTDSENKETGKELTYTPKHVLSILPSYELEKYGLGTSATVSYIGKQYTNSDNTDEIDAHTVVDAKIYKNLSDKAKLSFEADNIFDSDKGDEGNFRTGRTFTVKLDVTF
ncbi:MAG: TonB-dependent receptor [Deltaproteobacteria bacterium]|jgi:outer membrane receptor for ferrienterochelin and colicins|nr:TonB-dependent receptor [Deltaproteobacteria bacterium]